MRAQSVVVAADGTEASRSAISWASAEARRRGQPLRIVHVFDWDWSTARYGYAGDLFETGRRHAEGLVAGLASRVRDEVPGVEVEIDVLIGDPAAQLIIDSEYADLMVLGSRGHGGFAGLRLGSVSQRVAMHAHCPVAVIHDETSPGRRSATTDAGAGGDKEATTAVHGAGEPVPTSHRNGEPATTPRGHGEPATTLHGHGKPDTVNRAGAARDERVAAADLPTVADRPVVAGVDDSPAADGVLETAFTAAHQRGVKLVVIRSYLPPFPRYRGVLPPGELHTPQQDAAEHVRLAEQVAPWQSKFPDVAVDLLVTHDGAAGVLVGVSHGAQLVIVGSRGHGVIAGTLLGSTGLQLLHHAESPVLIVRSPGKGRADT